MIFFGDTTQLYDSIHESISQNDVERLASLLSRHVSRNVINQKNHAGRTPLHEASCKGYYDVAKLLVDSHADVQAKTSFGWTPLHFASNGYFEVAKLLVDAGANVDVFNSDGSAPLHLALSSGQFDTVKILVDAGANVKLTDKAGKSALDYLVALSNVGVNAAFIGEFFKLFTAAGATVDGATAEISPLVPSDVIRAIVPEDIHFWLAANNDAPMLAAELAGGLDPNMKTENGMTLLHWACAGDAPECVQLLLDAGAEKDLGFPPIIFYCMHESSECLKHLIQTNVDVNEPDINCFPIHLALAANSPACVTALVGAGAWVSKKEVKRGSHLVSLIAKSCKMRPVPVDALRALLAAAGERVLSEKINGMPPLYWAVEHSTLEIVELLLEAGANVNQKYKEYQNVLEFAKVCYSDCDDSTFITRLTQLIEEKSN